MTHTALVAQLQAGPTNGWWGVATAVGVLLAIVAWLEVMRRSFKENQRLRRQLAVAHEQSSWKPTPPPSSYWSTEEAACDGTRALSPPSAGRPTNGSAAIEDLFSDDAGVFGAAKGSHSLPPQEARPGDGDRVVRNTGRGKSGTEHFAVVGCRPKRLPPSG